MELDLEIRIAQKLLNFGSMKISNNEQVTKISYKRLHYSRASNGSRGIGTVTEMQLLKHFPIYI